MLSETQGKLLAEPLYNSKNNLHVPKIEWHRVNIHIPKRRNRGIKRDWTKSYQNPGGQTLSRVAPYPGPTGYTVVRCELQKAWAPPLLWSCLLQSTQPLLSWLCSLFADFFGRCSVFLASPSSWNLHCSFGFRLRPLHIDPSRFPGKNFPPITYCLLLKPSFVIWIEASQLLYPIFQQQQHQWQKSRHLDSDYSGLWIPGDWEWETVLREPNS